MLIRGGPRVIHHSSAHVATDGLILVMGIGRKPIPTMSVQVYVVQVYSCMSFFFIAPLYLGKGIYNRVQKRAIYSFFFL